MKTRAVLLSLLAAAAPAAAASRAARILFLGNSFTSVNDLPAAFAALARAKGRAVETGTLSPGGWGFSEHARDPETPRRLAAEPWDFVILQDQSQRPSFDDAQTAVEVYPFAARLVALIRASRPPARPVFYETWGRKDGDASNCKEVPALCTYEGMQDRLSRAYRELARRNRAALAPVGDAWRRVRRSRPDIELYAGDGVHPSAAGTYLAACVFYDILFADRCAGAPAPAGLAPAQAKALQQAADAVAARRSPSHAPRNVIK